jgi:NADH-quinone oxidoreductase subunit K
MRSAPGAFPPFTFPKVPKIAYGRLPAHAVRPKRGETVAGGEGRGGHHMAEPNVLFGYYVVSSLLFVIGMFGIFLNRKNIISILMAIELILLSVNLNFVAFSAHFHDLTGQIYALFILTVAAAESAIGLAIAVVLFRNLKSVEVEDITALKG